MKEAINFLKINHTCYVFPLLKMQSYMFTFYMWTKCAINYIINVLNNTHYYLKYIKHCIKYLKTS